MRTVIGVDSEDFYREAIHLLGRLDFVGNWPILASVTPSIVSPAMVGVLLPPCPEAVRIDHAASERLMAEAERACDDASLSRHREHHRLTGNVADEILRLAEEKRAELIAVGSRRKGPIGSAFLGSIGRALAIGGDRSFLVARGGMSAHGSVRAVFATDHSPYADRCLDWLLQLDPVGLTDIRIVFATDLSRQALRAALSVADDEDLSIDELRAKVSAKGDALVQRVLESGRQAEYHVVDEYASDALRSSMYAKKADVLIVGAQGHGVLERLVIGSLSLHMVVAEPFSVLVLRLPEEE
ncbi:MAG: universal stress protein [Fimbriimonas sp.]